MPTKRAAKAAAELPVLAFEADNGKETVRTFMFVEDEGDNQVCGKVYLQKSAFGDVVPGRIRVTVEVLSAAE